MLKLEKTSRNGLKVIVRDKENRFTQPFAIAFGIAVGIHLGLVILFHVVPFKIGMSENVFPPTRVHADTALKESAIAQIAPAVKSIRGLPPLPVSEPVLASTPKFLAFRPVEFSSAKNLASTSFAQIEKEVYQPEFNPMENRPKKPFQIIVSGVLAEHGIVSDGMDKKTVPALKKDSVRITYAVQVEGKTGRIFWYEPKQGVLDAAVTRFAEAVLQDMKFAMDPAMIAMGGEVEMHFNPEAG